MKKIFSVLLAALSFLICNGQDISNLGYCSGEVNSQGTLTVEGKTWVSGAMFLPSSMLGPYDGCEIVKVRAGLAARLNIDSLRVWVRYSLDGENLSEGLITTKTTPKIAKGWNEVELDSRVEIDSSRDLYVGFSYRQKTATAAFSIIGSTLENAFFAQLGEDAEWEDISSVGILSVEAVVEGDISIDYDLALISALTATQGSISEYEVSVTVANNGKKAVTGFTFETSYANLGVVCTNHFDEVIEPGGKSEVKYTIPAYDLKEAGDINVYMAGIDDGEDAVMANNYIVAHLVYVKKVLIEEFTTESCGNCPRVARYLHDVLNEDEYADKAIVVCHHSGYGTDWLTQGCDIEMMGFFGVNYAPAMMFDRTPVFVVDGSSKLHVCPSINDIKSGIDECLKSDTHVMIGFSTDYDKDYGKLSVSVHVERNGVFAEDRAYLTVYLVENNVEAKAQTSADTNPYYHQHVIRAYNDTWGDKITWSLNKFSKEYTFDMDESWNPENMEVVAVVGSYNPEDAHDCMIDNVEKVPVIRKDAGIDKGAVFSEEPISVSYYDLSGMEVRDTDMEKGIYIVKKQYKDGTCDVRKVIIR